MTLQEKARELAQTQFLGGPIDLFELAGRMQLILLLTQGLYPASKVLDIGCGCLRAGYWLIHFLDTNCYFGIEPNREMLRAGIDTFLEPNLLEMKSPHFDHNADFDFSVFGQRFDYLLARSIWTHASKPQIRRMLDGFLHHAALDGVFVTSYLQAAPGRGYNGDDWKGRSHVSETPGMVEHSFEWIHDECTRRGLDVAEISEPALNFGGQTWLRIAR